MRNSVVFVRADARMSSHVCMLIDSMNFYNISRHLKEKMRRHSKKDEAKWKLLVSRLIAAKNSLGPFSAGQSVFV